MSQPREHIDLDCGIAHARIRAWLADELALPYANAFWTYWDGSQSCSVSIEELAPRTLATVSLERTRLVAEGDAEALESFYKLFTLRFISAGG